MRKKDILELRRRFKKDDSTFTKVCGCYVNDKKDSILKFRESFLNLDDDEYFKYLDIAKKVLSGRIGNNILELNFLTDENLTSEKQLSFIQIKNSQLKDNSLLDDFYKSIIDNYNYTGNFLILLFHDIYDVIGKTTDNISLDESEEVYEYVLCAICPVSLSKPGLKYFEEENIIKTRMRDWIVGPPANGFIFPAFIDRSADINSIIYYTKNAKDIHTELMEDVLGCYSKQTATIQKETFQSIIKDSFNDDEKKADKVFMEIQDNLNNMIDEHNSMYDDDEDIQPITLSKDAMQNILLESGIAEEVTSNIEISYTKNFADDLPLAEHLIDKKILKENIQRKKEKDLQKQVEVLESKLKQIQQGAAVDNDTKNINLDDNEIDNPYDIVLKVKPEKVSEIKTRIIDGQNYIIIPINENEQTTVNGLDDLI